MTRKLARGALPPGLDADRLLVVLDFDGTLAPLVAVPQRATIGVVTRHALTALARVAPVVVLSGRARGDLVPRLGKVRFRLAIGNHGSEWTSSPPPARLRARVARWRAALVPALLRFDGVWVEDKAWSIAVHTRAVDEPAVARRVRRVVAQAAPDAVVQEGKAVVNVWPPGADKAAAMAKLRRQWPSRTIVFVGDDTNDELVFAAHMRDVVSIRVGPVQKTSARYLLAGQGDVAPLLAALVVAVSRSPVRATSGLVVG